MSQIAGRDDAVGRTPSTRLFVVPPQSGSPARHRLDALCRDVAEVAGNAVDTLEIAVSLEVRGIGDRTARDEFDCADVFDLAAQIGHRTGRTLREPDEDPSPWRATPTRYAVHGLLYGLPALCWPASAPLATGRPALALLVVSILLSWSLSQAVSYLGYVHLNVDDTRDARTVLRRSGGVGLAVSTVTLLAVSLFVAARPGALLFAVGQASYLIAASVLMVLAAERWLLVALVPGVLGGAVFLLSGQPGPWFPAVWACMSATTLAAVVLAAWRARVPEGERRPLVWRARVPDLAGNATFGALAAGLLTLPLVVAQVTNRSLGPAGFAAVLALSISMGAAEASLAWFRRRATALMHRSSDFLQFGRRARAMLVAGLALFSAAAAVLMAVCSWGAALLGARVDPWSASSSYLVLGAALFLALVIRALGGSPVVAPAMAGAVAVEIVMEIVSGSAGAGPLHTQLWVCGGLLLVLVVDGMRVLGDPGRHV